MTRALMLGLAVALAAFGQLPRDSVGGGPGGGSGLNQLTGDVLAGPGTGSQAATIANDAVTLAKLANLGTGTVIARATAGTGDPEALTPSQLVDIIGATRGSLLYRGASGWAILTPGTSGDFLKSNGAGADPAYASVTASPGGSDTFVQFNDGGVFGGDAGLTYNKTTDVLTAAGGLNSGDGSVAGSLTLIETTPNGSNFRKLSIPDALTADLDFRYPNTVPTVESVLVWGAASGGQTIGSFASMQPLKARGFGAGFSGSSVANGEVAYTSHPTACTISAWSIRTDATAATVKLWKKATGTAVPTVADVINTSGVSISTGTVIRSTTLTDFTTTAVAANDEIAVVLSGVTGAPTFLQFFAECGQ